MPAYRLLDAQGERIGALFLDNGRIENEILNGHPDLKLTYSETLDSVAFFSLELVPPND